MTSGPDDIRATLTTLLETDPAAGTAAVFDVLAGEPRLKPSRSLLIDPGDDVHRRWRCRVDAAAALLSSPAAVRVSDELLDELAADPDLAHDVLSHADPHPDLPAARRALLRALGGRGTP